jgi:hypothetical protein
MHGIKKVLALHKHNNIDHTNSHLHLYLQAPPEIFYGMDEAEKYTNNTR